jgi:hypothetical protein
MTYPFIALGLIVVFIIYVLYLLVKKDMKRLNTVLYPGLFFIVLWAAIYFFLLK